MSHAVRHPFLLLEVEDIAVARALADAVAAKSLESQESEALLAGVWAKLEGTLAVHGDFDLARARAPAGQDRPPRPKRTRH